MQTVSVSVSMQTESVSVSMQTVSVSEFMLLNCCHAQWPRVPGFSIQSASLFDFSVLQGQKCVYSTLFLGLFPMHCIPHDSNLGNLDICKSYTVKTVGLLFSGDGIICIILCYDV